MDDPTDEEIERRSTALDRLGGTSRLAEMEGQILDLQQQLARLTEVPLSARVGWAFNPYAVALSWVDKTGVTSHLLGGTWHIAAIGESWVLIRNDQDDEALMAAVTDKSDLLPGFE